MTDLEQAIANVKRLKSEAKESAAGYRARIAEARRAVFKATRAEMREDARQVPLPLEVPSEDIGGAIHEPRPLDARGKALMASMIGAPHEFSVEPLILAKGDHAPLCVCGKREEHSIHAPGPDAALAQARARLGVSA